jgi:hypothetical protein
MMMVCNDALGSAGSPDEAADSPPDQSVQSRARVIAFPRSCEPLTILAW